MTKLGASYKLHPNLLKQEINQDEIYEITWEDKEKECLPLLKNCVFSNTFSRGRYSADMEEIAGFGMKHSLTLPSSAKYYLNSLRVENNEPICTYNNVFMRRFVRQSNIMR